MPYSHNTVPLHQDTTTYDHTASPTAFSSSAIAHNVYDPVAQVNGSAGCRPHVVPFTAKPHHLRPARQSYQQHEQRQHQHERERQGMQATPVHKVHSMEVPPKLYKQQHRIGGSAVTTLLPYCTAEAPLNEEQIIAVTDIAGSLKELVLLALRAKDGDEEELSRLEGALGNEHAVAGVVDFFSDEFEIQ